MVTTNTQKTMSCLPLEDYRESLWNPQNSSLSQLTFMMRSNAFEFRVSWSRVLLDNLPNLLLIGDAILLEEIVCISLSWRFRVGLIQKRLNAE